MQGTPIPQLLGDQWSGEKVLVTGASGFKGSWLCKALLELPLRVDAAISMARNLPASRKISVLMERYCSPVHYPIV
jgi:nucleoside-diphosphate-sugar epimerase